MTTVAILGTGKMGGAMARRLVASGFDVTLWNRTPDKAEALHLGRVAATPADAARDADVIISSLTNEAAIRDVYLGEHGVLRSAAGKLLIEMSTAGPEVVEALDREAQAHGAHLLEAPVVGSVPAVESGKLLILVAGEPADLETARPVLERLGDVSYVGQRGNAQRLKLIANSMLGITSTAAAELLAAGVALGLERAQVFSILVRFAPGLGARERGFLHDEHTPTMFAVRDLLKDLDLGLRAYGNAGVATPLVGAARERFAAAMTESADLDISAIVRA
jgi:3-hydroxyisobutyrate dehydrogenase-like beta-hydroxyacid dehydrogenase